MTDQAQARKLLSELSKREDLGNKVCADCNNPNPQWASLSFAIFICLQCAGTHRGFGVHISFVRSISMDTWQEEQLKRMQIGGNAPFKAFVESYTPVDQGGYKASASAYDRYHSWAAAQYKEKLDAMLSGKEWTQSMPPPGFQGGVTRSASPNPGATQGLRKARASARSAPTRSDSASPSIRSSSDAGAPNPTLDQKTQNENYFASLGRANESRPDHLPPSQGGRYTGFGSTPTPSANQNPLSSANAPSLYEFQENPAAALSKGWSLFAAAVGGAAKVVTENVIQPAAQTVTDPNFQATVRGYMTEAQKKAAMVGGAANDWSRTQFGVDVADTVGGAVGAVRERVAGPATRGGYGQLSMTSPNDYGPNGSSSLYSPDDTEDFFTEYREAQAKPAQQSSFSSSAVPSATSTLQAKKPKAKQDDDWDDW